MASAGIFLFRKQPSFLLVGNAGGLASNTPAEKFLGCYYLILNAPDKRSNAPTLGRLYAGVVTKTLGWFGFAGVCAQRHAGLLRASGFFLHRPNRKAPT